MLSQIRFSHCGIFVEYNSLGAYQQRLEEALAPSAGHGYGGANGVNGHGNGHGATVEGTAVLLRDQLAGSRSVTVCVGSCLVTLLIMFQF